MRVCAGNNDFFREHRLRHLPDELVHLLKEHFLAREPRCDEIERQPFGVLELRGPGRPERSRHAVQFAAREAVREREHRGAVDADHARFAFFDHGLQQLPLLVAPQLGLASADRSAASHGPRGRTRLEHAALRRATERESLDARSVHGRAGGRALVEEHVDGAPTSREGLRRDNRGEDGVLVVLAHRHDPEVDAVPCASAAAGTCRGALSATPAASPPARAACRTAAQRPGAHCPPDAPAWLRC